ncbi:hypothetical protein [Pectobacterium carotovorum]|uniref:hypothetical protein n=1 Tax=Pectobacterium carotovorum TaxID=554 RepID=UPI00050336A5|nr:hypothetical protein [Pectobacterium carotovorum]KFW97553.1 hypothetical protein JV33_21695 [Pectobacterium carotovorum subsp. carotovorum]KML64933.1 hypothetical protein G032_20940 [Pectobacterium carotovorum subsp. carotovorum ICMP 5702]SHH72935.1 hypothetical protein SAMN05444147_1214 [Pectobacterium carotovorum]
MKKEVKTAIHIEGLSDHALAELIKMAMDEFQRRLGTASINTVKSIDIEPVVIHAPSDNDMVFINNCLKRRRSNNYIIASMKTKYRELAVKYPQWFSAKGYPDSLRGSTSKHYVDYLTKNE